MQRTLYDEAVQRPTLNGSGWLWRLMATHQRVRVYLFFFLWRATAGQFLLLLSSWGQSDTQRTRLSTNSIFRNMWERRQFLVHSVASFGAPPPLIFIFHAVVLSLFCSPITLSVMALYILEISTSFPSMLPLLMQVACPTVWHLHLQGWKIRPKPARLSLSMHAIHHTFFLIIIIIIIITSVCFSFELSVVSWFSSFFSHLPACLSSYISFTHFLPCFCEISHLH